MTAINETAYCKLHVHKEDVQIFLEKSKSNLEWVEVELHICYMQLTRNLILPKFFQQNKIRPSII